MKAKFNDDDFQRRLNELSRGLENRRDLFQKLSRVFLNKIKLCFKQSKDPLGVQWKPIHHREGQPLLDSGILRRSINSTTLKDSFKIGTATEYAARHQFGGVMKVTIPAHTRKITKAFGRPVPEKVVNVKQHERNSFVHARPFFPVNKNGDLELPRSWIEATLRNGEKWLNNL